MQTAVKQPAGYSDEAINMKFLELMPVIVKLAIKNFAGYPTDRRSEAIQTTVCWAFLNLKNLAAKGRLHDAYAGAITRFAVGRHHSGRSFGTVTSSTDAMSSFCRSLGRVHTVRNYGLAENITDSFESESTAGDARSSPDKIVQFKIDFHETWLASQSPRDQQIIRLLASGESPSNTARLVGVSPACINQYQKRYAKSWSDFIKDRKKVA
jgi:hypothetical protein